MRLIDADALAVIDGKVLFMGRNAGKMRAMTVDLVKQLVATAPTIDAVEVRHGEWVVFAWDGKDWAVIPYKEGQHTDPFCSRCKEPAWREPRGGHGKPSKYCPNCGAKMDGKGDKDGL